MLVINFCDGAVQLAWKPESTSECCDVWWSRKWRIWLLETLGLGCEEQLSQTILRIWAGWKTTWRYWSQPPHCSFLAFCEIGTTKNRLFTTSYHFCCKEKIFDIFINFNVWKTSVLSFLTSFSSLFSLSATFVVIFFCSLQILARC